MEKLWTRRSSFNWRLNQHYSWNHWVYDWSSTNSDDLIKLGNGLEMDVQFREESSWNWEFAEKKDKSQDFYVLNGLIQNLLNCIPDQFCDSTIFFSSTVTVVYYLLPRKHIIGSEFETIAQNWSVESNFTCKIHRYYRFVDSLPPTDVDWDQPSSCSIED